MIRNRWLTAALAMGAALGIAGTVGVLPAVGQTSPPSSAVILGTSAHIIANGAAVKPYAYVVCQPGDFAQLQISITEKSGHGIASGTGYADSFNCTGQIEKLSVPVTAFGKPFVKGTAFGQAVLLDCGPFNCGQAIASHKVTLKATKKK